MTQARNGEQTTSLAKSSVRAYPYAARQLPPPDEPFMTRELPDQAQRIMLHFIANGVVQEHRSRFDRDGNANAALWTTNPEIYAYIESNLTDRPTWPRCVHGGLRNLGDGEYTCSERTCGEIYTRDEAEAYLAARRSDNQQVAADGGTNS